MEGWRGREKDPAVAWRFGGRGRDWEKWGLKEERMTAVRDGQRKGWSPSFLDFPLALTVRWAPIKEASRDWTPLIPVQINFLADRSVSLFDFFFLSTRLQRREGGRDFSIPVLFRLYQSPKRQMKSWSLLFHDNNHLVTSHIRLNLSYTSLQINLCQPTHYLHIIGVLKALQISQNYKTIYVCLGLYSPTVPHNHSTF